MSKKVPKNTNFDYIEPTVDTGASLSRRMKEWEEFREDYKVSKDEIFRRIKPIGFVKLILHLAETNGSNYFSESVYEDSKILPNDESKCLETNRSAFERFTSGFGEVNQYDTRNNSHSESTKIEKIVNISPYLLLDVRLKEEYDLGHIIKSQNYPSAMVGRSVNFESPAMLLYKNKPGFIIIIYDNDESIAPKVATVLVQRGYENVLMLSGGLKVCWKKFPQGLIVGRIPESVQNAILSTSGMTNFQKAPYRKFRFLNYETESLNSESVNDLTQKLGRMSSTAPAHHHNDISDGRSMISSRTSTSIRSNMSRYNSRRKYDIHDFEPYCGANSRRKSDHPDEEEFTLDDLAHLSMAIDQSDNLSTISTASRSRTKSCGSVRRFHMK